MRDTSIIKIEKEMERVRGKLHAMVKGDVTLLLDKETYLVSSELDKLIVSLMKNELKK